MVRNLLENLDDTGEDRAALRTFFREPSTKAHPGAAKKEPNTTQKSPSCEPASPIKGANRSRSTSVTSSGGSSRTDGLDASHGSPWFAMTSSSEGAGSANSSIK